MTELIVNSSWVEERSGDASPIVEDEVGGL
jgi:hypothetical protein